MYVQNQLKWKLACNCIRIAYKKRYVEQGECLFSMTGMIGAKYWHHQHVTVSYTASMTSFNLKTYMHSSMGYLAEVPPGHAIKLSNRVDHRKGWRKCLRQRSCELKQSCRCVDFLVGTNSPRQKAGWHQNAVRKMFLLFYFPVIKLVQLTCLSDVVFLEVGDNERDRLILDQLQLRPVVSSSDVSQ